MKKSRFKESQIIGILKEAELIAAACVLFDGNKDYAIEWLNSPEIVLNWVTPMEFAITEERTQTVLKLICRLDHGIVT